MEFWLWLRRLAVVMVLSGFPLASVLSREPYVVGAAPVVVADPEISRVYFDELAGTPRYYIVRSPVPFTLKLQIAVPAHTNPYGRYGVQVFWGSLAQKPYAALPNTGIWQRSYDPLTGNSFVNGPRLTEPLPAGSYLVEVTGNGDRGKYALVVGDPGRGTVWGTVRAMVAMPPLRRSYFGISPASFAFTLLGCLYLIVSVGAGVVIAAAARAVGRGRNRTHRYECNIGVDGRMIRLGLGIVCLVLGLADWNALLFASAGFVLYESASGWCAVVAVLPRKSVRPKR
jgi:hypothetical protein